MHTQKGYKRCAENNLRQQLEEKKTVGHITPTWDRYPRKGQMRDTDPCSDMSC